MSRQPERIGQGISLHNVLFSILEILLPVGEPEHRLGKAHKYTPQRKTQYIGGKMTIVENEEPSSQLSNGERIGLSKGAS